MTDYVLELIRMAPVQDDDARHYPARGAPAHAGPADTNPAGCDHGVRRAPRAAFDWLVTVRYLAGNP
ncbi:hypothetical protein [Burkholderia gladioli]|uniref:hypothetical protein n=1 Tax=Burkholderia gladioli TaxID=28095 RepID=UPI000B14D4A1|nr:hypothetical protein [Burkholderia gladioli]